MIDKSFRPKLAMNKTQTNVLMTQIRAQKKTYNPKVEPVYVSSHRDSSQIGKRVYKQQKYKTTCLYPNTDRSKSHSQHSLSPIKSGKKPLCCPYRKNVSSNFTNILNNTHNRQNQNISDNTPKKETGSRLTENKGKRIFLKELYTGDNVILDFPDRKSKSHRDRGLNRSQSARGINSFRKEQTNIYSNKFGRRRNDNSPVHQNRLSPGFRVIG